MALLAGTMYDPGAAVSKSTASLLAMTAFDTTNLRLTFTAPANGAVLVRIACAPTGSGGGVVHYLLGVLDGATVRGRVAGISGGGAQTATATDIKPSEAVFVVSGLTPTTSYTWDAAYGVESVVASTNIKYGGPNDATGADAWGGIAFEIWDTPTLLGSVLYDPAAAGTTTLTALAAMTAIDTTNARITFTAPAASGTVFWRIRTLYTGSATMPAMLFGILSGASVVARTPPIWGMPHPSGSSNWLIHDASGLISGLAGSNTFDAAVAVQVVGGAGANLKYGGPNNTTANDAFGALAYEIWTA
jgi:hypothetical protein